MFLRSNLLSLVYERLFQPFFLEALVPVYSVISLFTSSLADVLFLSFFTVLAACYYKKEDSIVGYVVKEAIHQTQHLISKVWSK